MDKKTLSTDESCIQSLPEFQKTAVKKKAKARKSGKCKMTDQKQLMELAQKILLKVDTGNETTVRSLFESVKAKYLVVAELRKHLDILIAKEAIVIEKPKKLVVPQRSLVLTRRKLGN